ncbi:hypothetical protein Calhy_0749 [Caldicellulosiruptor hydrothermalis 108]|uniref:Uncharacterized protein n=1 Tax=Caldicellulosiruptor hydrothermalis (strain DSM 18901 / VKM B-2411 / 108) TaxID=632292 RepID=E4QDR9_CALH1|nr:hypothetical protein [Caldicellulosiruptor hydrothermalis]ADQ06486.1 hypothetical protein Calhy_0749 [Caldicellulosiruptor hydrothermalis 108]
MANTNKIPESAYMKSHSEQTFENLSLQKKEEVSFLVPKVAPKIAEAIKRELKGINLKFKRIRMPTGGSTVFEIPTSDPNNPIVAKELIGVILYHHPMNIYWKDKNSNNPVPDCYSIDGEKGIGEPGGKCSTCPYNQFVKGKAKPCKNIRRLYIIIDKPFPYEFNVPPTSINNFIEYIQDVASQGYFSYEIITKVGLRKVTNKEGITYAQAVFSMVKELDEQSKEEMAKLAQSIEQLAQRVAIIDNNEDSEEIEIKDDKDTTNVNIDIEGFEEAPTQNDDDLPF